MCGCARTCTGGSAVCDQQDVGNTKRVGNTIGAVRGQRRQAREPGSRRLVRSLASDSVAPSSACSASQRDFHLLPNRCAAAPPRANSCCTRIRAVLANTTGLVCGLRPAKIRTVLRASEQGVFLSALRALRLCESFSCSETAAPPRCCVRSWAVELGGSLLRNDHCRGSGRVRGPRAEKIFLPPLRTLRSLRESPSFLNRCAPLATTYRLPTLRESPLRSYSSLPLFTTSTSHGIFSRALSAVLPMKMRFKPRRATAPITTRSTFNSSALRGRRSEAMPSSRCR